MNYEELSLQSRCHIWLRNTYTERSYMKAFAIKNEEPSVRRRIINKSVGVVKGVADYIIFFGNSNYMFIEFKTSKGKQTVEQKFFEAIHKDNYCLIRSFDGFKELVELLYKTT